MPLSTFLRQKILAAAALGVSLVNATPASAGLIDAKEAHERGDFTTAAQELQPLAATGNAAAQAHLGSLYLSGRGVQRDLEQARIWMEKAARQGNVGAKLGLGILLSRHPSQDTDQSDARRWLKAAGDDGVVEAQYQAALLLDAGIGGPPDPATAAEWLRLAASAKHMDATTLLAMLHLEGRGVPEDSEQASRLIETAASAGDERAIQLRHLLETLSGGKQPVPLSALAGWDRWRRAGEIDLGSKTDKVMAVKSPKANLRIKPAPKAQVVAQMEQDRPVYVLVRRGEWSMVATPDAVIGWMNQSTLAASTPGDVQRPATASVRSAGSQQLELFGVSLTTADRPTMQQALSALGARDVGNGSNQWPGRYNMQGLANYRTWFDLYDGKGLLDGAIKLEVGYAKGARFAVARYIFSNFDVLNGQRLVEMLKQKYGPSSVRHSGFDEEHVWRRGDVVIRAGSKHMTGPFLVYEVPEVFRQLEQEIEDARQNAVRRKAVQQSGRF
ncbi:SEL1-like repeat protein [Azospirillum sp. YIM DDC1]|uniref:SEL1-like repeat protein n=1 Tax=Azospirillum aestuarii TaxID=2802052 RepID=A0ABS1HS27_9PROT|nr:SH3 domain-containing protein [Azospirillum aestuarii]MBK4717618.1 SEL1-like repeat protein [Azospirillum aestuarii]